MKWNNRILSWWLGRGDDSYVDFIANAYEQWGDTDDTCPACGGDGFVRCQEYYNDTQNYSPDEFELCPDCAGDGVIGS